MSSAKPGPAHVYRCYDNSGRLIYIGATCYLFRRLEQHRRSSWWSPQVAKVRAKVYRTWELALLNERAAIVRERPRWNTALMRADRRLKWSRENYRDYVTSVCNGPGHAPAYGRLVAVQAEYARRFGEHLDIGPDPRPRRGGAA